MDNRAIDNTHMALKITATIENLNYYRIANIHKKSSMYRYDYRRK